MSESHIAKRYARALFALAVEQSSESVDDYGRQLEIFVKACRAEPALLNTLANRYFDLSARDRIIDAVVVKLALDTNVGNFLKLLVHKGRASLVREIVEAYQNLAHVHNNREVMMVVSALELPDQQYEAIRERFALLTGKTMVLSKKTLPSVLGGARVHIRDKVYDYTVKNQLERLKEKMLA